jgi:hypothetical protein
MTGNTLEVQCAFKDLGLVFIEGPRQDTLFKVFPAFSEFWSVDNRFTDRYIHTTLAERKVPFGLRLFECVSDVGLSQAMKQLCPDGAMISPFWAYQALTKKEGSGVKEMRSKTVVCALGGFSEPVVVEICVGEGRGDDLRLASNFQPLPAGTLFLVEGKQPN